MTRFVAKAPEVSDLEVDGDFLVFDGTELHRLVGSAADIWRSIQGSTSVEDIVRRVQDLHPADRQVADDVRLFIDDLITEGLVQEEPTSASGFGVPPHVAWCTDADATVVLADLRSGARFQLSTFGASIWSAAVIHATAPEALKAAVMKDYPDAPDDVQELINDLLESLSDAGLLERRPRP